MANRESKSSPRRLTAKQRELRAVQLRQIGLSFEQIGQELGVTKSAAHKAYKRAMAKTEKLTVEEAEELRELELKRLDMMQVGLMPKATKGDPQAVDRVLRIMERRSKYLGLDSPSAIRIGGDSENPLRVEDSESRSKLVERILALQSAKAATEGDAGDDA